MNYDNANYLDDLAAKAEYYHQIKNKSVKYISKNQLYATKELCVNIMLISALWASKQIETKITEDDLEIFFGLKTDGANILDDFFELPQGHANMTLLELHNETVRAFNQQ